MKFQIWLKQVGSNWILSESCRTNSNHIKNKAFSIYEVVGYVINFNIWLNKVEPGRNRSSQVRIRYKSMAFSINQVASHVTNLRIWFTQSESSRIKSEPGQISSNQMSKNSACSMNKIKRYHKSENLIASGQITSNQADARNKQAGE